MEDIPDLHQFCVVEGNEYLLEDLGTVATELVDNAASSVRSAVLREGCSVFELVQEGNVCASIAINLSGPARWANERGFSFDVLSDNGVWQNIGCMARCYNLRFGDGLMMDFNWQGAHKTGPFPLRLRALKGGSTLWVPTVAADYLRIN